MKNCTLWIQKVGTMVKRKVDEGTPLTMKRMCQELGLRELGSKC